MKPELINSLATIVTAAFVLLTVPATWFCVLRLNRVMGAFACMLAGAVIGQGIVGELSYRFEGAPTLTQKIALAVTETIFLAVVVAGAVSTKKDRRIRALAARAVRDSEPA